MHIQLAFCWKGLVCISNQSIMAEQWRDKEAKYCSWNIAVKDEGSFFVARTETDCYSLKKPHHEGVNDCQLSKQLRPSHDVRRGVLDFRSSIEGNDHRSNYHLRDKQQIMLYIFLACTYFEKLAADQFWPFQSCIPVRFLLDQIRACSWKCQPNVLLSRFLSCISSSSSSCHLCNTSNLISRIINGW